MTDRYGVVGHPIAHSKSPFIHTKFAAQTGQDMEYGQVEVPVHRFTSSIRQLMAEGWSGVNVSLPFKIQAFALADIVSDRALAAQAVNTLTFKKGGIYGDNTDGAGLVADLRSSLQYPLLESRVLLIGAGGAARGVIKPLLDAGVNSLTITNRTYQKSLELAAFFNIDALPMTDCVSTFDLIINATSASVSGATPDLPACAFGLHTLAYDMFYARGPTAFMQMATSQGARTADGLGMLVAQAAEAFFIWRGVRPDTSAVLTALRAAVLSNA